MHLKFFTSPHPHIRAGLFISLVEYMSILLQSNSTDLSDLYLLFIRFISKTKVHGKLWTKQTLTFVDTERVCGARSAPVVADS